MCAKIIKGSTFVIIKLSYTKQTNQLWIVNMSYLLQPVCPSPHSRVTQQSYQHINISSTCHIILYFILFVDVPLNLISKMFFLSFASLSIILNKSDLSRLPLFYLSFHFLFFFFFFCLVGVRTIVIFLLLLSTLHSCWFYSRTWARTQQIKRTQLYFTFYAGMKWSVKLSDTSKSKLSFFNGKTSFFCRHIEKDGRNRHIAN